MIEFKCKKCGHEWKDRILTETWCCECESEDYEWECEHKEVEEGYDDCWSHTLEQHFTRRNGIMTCLDCDEVVEL